MNTTTPLLVDKRKSQGAHYTPKELARFVAHQISRICTAESPLVLDPACGDGELLLAFQEERPAANLVGFDLDSEALETAKERVNGRIEQQDFLEVAFKHMEDDLFHRVEKFDVVIANPPYVRTQVLGATRAQELAVQFDLSGRVDIYFAFLEGIAKVLNPGGLAGVIVSNRFMTTKAGATVRERILDRFNVLHVWDLGDTKLFDAAVLPAVLLLRKKGDQTPYPSQMSSIYTTNETPEVHVTSPLKALDIAGVIGISNRTFLVKHGVLDHSDGIWRIGTQSGDQWLETVRANTFCTFGDIGKIRVGVKTTADGVFVRKEWPEPRPELLRPLITHNVARRYLAFPADREILYPHVEKNGQKIAVNLDKYPISKAYLESKREVLEARTYVLKAGRQWFEIWVAHKPSFWKRPKLVFQDIAEKPTFWMSLDDQIVQGDCYWLAIEDDKDIDLLWLALAVANSRFIEEFYDHSFHNKLYAGRRRFMTQYVEKFPVPNPRTPLAKKIVTTVKRIYETTPSDKANHLADELAQYIREAFGLK